MGDVTGETTNNPNNDIAAYVSKDSYSPSVDEAVKEYINNMPTQQDISSVRAAYRTNIETGFLTAALNMILNVCLYDCVSKDKRFFCFAFINSDEPDGAKQSLIDNDRIAGIVEFYRYNNLSSYPTSITELELVKAGLMDKSKIGTNKRFPIRYNVFGAEYEEEITNPETKEVEKIEHTFYYAKMDIVLDM